MLPPVVIVVIIAFTLVFNVVGTVLLFLYRTKSGSVSMAIIGCAIMSLLASLFAGGIIALFVKFPPDNKIPLMRSLIRQNEGSHNLSLLPRSGGTTECILSIAFH
ncbi:hypothetical protein KIN20_000192 [Parelaphostrongylus tenuis]|uniref:Uncharacterized protein n=1 Tax=Parelaphostrongylus tenuis TaxID=148309 RepID=A0AAD5MDA1_PARTN|nr:hypothetical protein KIN20_000192 [Parelaphostrongylus tenuis]